VGHWWASALLGPCGVLVLGVLCVLATAGFVQIYAQDAPTHLRRARLGLVFALLAAVMLGMPPEARRWSQREQALRVNETTAGAVDTSLAAMAAHAGSICWIAPRFP